MLNSDGKRGEKKKKQWIGLSGHWLVTGAQQNHLVSVREGGVRKKVPLSPQTFAQSHSVNQERCFN